MVELISRHALSGACYEIYAEVVGENGSMTAQQVKDLMLRFEHEIQAAPTVLTLAAEGAVDCVHYLQNGRGGDCSLLKECVCAIKGQCSFFKPKDCASAEQPTLSIPETIRRTRLEAGLSAVELAALAGVSPCALGRWERGEATPRPENFEKLTATLKVIVGKTQDRSHGKGRSETECRE